MIAIIDYGMGNLRSVQKAIEKIDCPVMITEKPEELLKADKAILPGVGAFGDGITEIKKRHLDIPIRAFLADGKPFLGICLGLQLLFSHSTEEGQHEGLGILPGHVVRMEDQPGLKVPHMGWNQIEVRKETPLLQDIPTGSYFYFVHAYVAQPENPAVIAAETPYPGPFTSIISHKNVMATQFHPEKSQDIGLRLLRNFAEL